MGTRQPNLVLSESDGKKSMFEEAHEDFCAEIGPLSALSSAEAGRVRGQLIKLFYPLR
jgi:hypothetical protein